jgi:hypothetical protein
MHTPLAVAGTPNAATAVSTGMSLGNMVIIGTLILSITLVIAAIFIANRIAARRSDEGV